MDRLPVFSINNTSWKHGGIQQGTSHARIPNYTETKKFLEPQHSPGDRTSRAFVTIRVELPQTLLIQHCQAIFPSRALNSAAPLNAFDIKHSQGDLPPRVRRITPPPLQSRNHNTAALEGGVSLNVLNW